MIIRIITMNLRRSVLKYIAKLMFSLLVSLYAELH